MFNKTAAEFLITFKSQSGICGARKQAHSLIINIR